MRFLIITHPQRGVFRLAGRTDDIVKHKAANPFGYFKYYDTQTERYVKPGKRGPVKDSRCRIQYGEIPNSLTGLAWPEYYTLTLSELAADYLESDDTLSDFDKEVHKLHVEHAIILGSMLAVPIPEKVLADYPDLVSKHQALLKPSPASEEPHE